MTGEIDPKVPEYRPLMFAVGASFAIAAAALFLWYRTVKPCDCEDDGKPGDPADGPWSAAEKASKRLMHHTIVNRVRTSNGGLPAEPGPDPLSWDHHAQNAWGAAFGGERTLDAWAAPADGVDEDEEQDQHRQD